MADLGLGRRLPRVGVERGGGAREAVAGRLPRGRPADRGRPGRGAGIEDSHNGILAARAAGLRTIAVPNHEFPPGEEALARADVVLSGLGELTEQVVAGD